ncbi:MAG: NUDIX domain-containing protein [Chloroflexi bacterium]|nr:NUDIX domain-containing protein [Chloroflexota bacterium]
MEKTMIAGQKRVAVLCILQSTEAFLLIHRAQDPNRGKYTPIGGKVDLFEGPRQAAYREVREETGLELPSVEVLRFRGVLIETSPTAYNWISFVYSAQVGHFEPPPCREGALEWVPIRCLADIPTPATDLTIYRYVLEGQPFVLDAHWSGELELLTMREELSGKTIYEAAPGSQNHHSTRQMNPFK